MRPRRALLFVLIQLTLLIDPHTPTVGVYGLEWNRIPSPPPLLSGVKAIEVVVHSSTLFAQTAFRLATNDSATTCPSYNAINTTRTVACAGREISSHTPLRCSYTNLTTLLFRYGGYGPPFNSESEDFYLSPWPVSRSGQQRWIRAPISGSKPRGRDGGTFISNAYRDSPLPGFAFLYGGATSVDHVGSLWALDLERAKWTPLGPPKLYDTKQPNEFECTGKRNLFVNGVLPPPAAKTNVDECYMSNITLSNTDEFGCAWPQNRQLQVSVLVGSTLWMIGGVLLDWTTIGEVWTLELDSHLRPALAQQAESTGGTYIYNTDQQKYHNNSADPTIDRDQLCPVHWKQLSRLDGSSSLLTQPSSAPFPPVRLSAAIAASGTQIFMSGGCKSWYTYDAYTDLWVLDTVKLEWHEMSAGMPDGRSLHGLFPFTLPTLRPYVVGTTLVDNSTQPDWSSCLDSPSSAFVVTIGTSGAIELIFDSYILIPACGVPAIPAPCSGKLLIPPQAWRYQWTWYRLDIATPSAAVRTGVFSRLGPEMVHLADQRILVLGGNDNAGSRTQDGLIDVIKKQADVLPLPSTALSIPTDDPTRPIPRTRYTHNAFIVRREMWVYGGLYVDTNTPPSRNEILAYSVDRFTWRTVGPLNNSVLLWPPSTFGGVVVASHMNQRIWQYAGGGFEETFQMQGQAMANCTTHVYSFDTSTLVWTNHTDAISSATPWTDQTSAEATGGYVKNGYLYPRGRCSAAGAILSTSSNQHELFIFGGELDYYNLGGVSGPTDNALWSLNLETLTWSLIQSTDRTIAIEQDGPGSPRPPGRRFHTMMPLDENRLFVGFGRDHQLHYLSAGWVWTRPSANASQAGSWLCISSPVSTPESPPARGQSQATMWQDTMLLYGGFLAQGPAGDDLHALSTKTLKWRRIYPEGTPAVRNRASLVTIDASLLYYGGQLDDPYVHVLELDEIRVGGQTSSNNIVHDLLAPIAMRTDIMFEFKIASSSSSSSLSSGVMVAPASRGAFVTLASGLIHLQDTLSAKTSTITILDTQERYSLRTTSHLAAVPIRTNVTFRTDRSPAVATSLARVEGIPRGVLDLGGRADAALLIDPTIDGASCSSSLSAYMLDLEIRNGRGADVGGCIRIHEAQVSLVNTAIRSCTATQFGGGLAIESSIVQLSSCEVDSCRADVGGGIYVVDSALTIDSSVLSNNSIIDLDTTLLQDAGQGGGLAILSSFVNVSNSHLHSNRARLGGGLAAMAIISQVRGAEEALRLQATSVHIYATLFESNYAREDGGAMFLSGLDTSGAEVLTTTFRRNHARHNGGGIYADSTQVVSSQTLFEENYCFGAGGGFFWEPSTTDLTLMNGPQFTPTQSLTFDTNMTQVHVCLEKMTHHEVGTSHVFDDWCNAAMYGPFLASSAASLRFSTNQRVTNATQYEFASGAIVTPPIVLVLIDSYGQIVTTDNTSFVSVSPSISLAGATSVQVQRGEATFDQLQLRIRPHSTVDIQFGTSLVLPLFERDQQAGLFDMQLHSAEWSSGLIVTSNTTFTQLASCLSLCTCQLPTSTGMHSASIQLTFLLNQFSSSFDKLNIFTETTSVEPFATFVGSELIAQIAQQQMTTTTMAQAHPIHRDVRILSTHIHHDVVTHKMSSNGHPRLQADTLTRVTYLTVKLAIPSPHVTLQLQTGDDRIGYVSGQFNLTSECPAGLRLHEPTDECLRPRESTETTRGVIIAICAVVAAIIVGEMITLRYYSRTPIFRAAGVSFSAAILTFLLMIPIAGIFFALLPAEGSDGICIARVWFGAIPVIGVLSILFAKAYRIVSIAHSSSLNKQLVSDYEMWMIVGICVILELGLCIGFTIVPLSRGVVRSQTISRSNDNHLVRQCSLEEHFTEWFAVQLSYVAILCIGSAYLSFQSRSVHSQFNESSHVASALFMLILCSAILVPVAILAQDSPDAIVIVQGGGAAFVGLVWSMILFAPKFWSSHHYLQLALKQKQQKLAAEAAAKVTAKAMKRAQANPNDTIVTHSSTTKDKKKDKSNTPVGDDQIQLADLRSIVACPPDQQQVAALNNNNVITYHIDVGQHESDEAPLQHVGEHPASIFGHPSVLRPPQRKKEVLKNIGGGSQLDTVPYEHDMNQNDTTIPRFTPINMIVSDRPFDPMDSTLGHAPIPSLLLSGHPLPLPPQHASPSVDAPLHSSHVAVENDSTPTPTIISNSISIPTLLAPPVSIVTVIHTNRI